MQNLHIWDVRLVGIGIRASANEVLRVGESVPLATMALWVIGQSDAYFRNDLRVTIYCHGIDEAAVLDPKTGKYPVIKTQGGFGLKLCKEELTLDTMDVMYFWRGKVKQIDILGCGAAYIVPGREGKIGDGNLFCFKLAQLTGSYVRATTSELHYTEGSELHWEGTVLTYDPTGAVVSKSPYD